MYGVSGSGRGDAGPETRNPGRKSFPSPRSQLDTMREVKVRLALILVPFVLVAGGCPTYRPSFDSDDPQMRLAEAVRSASRNDPADYPHLVEMLDDADIDARMLAIEVLERRTGTTRGFEYDAPPERREGPLKEWQAWALQFVRVEKSSEGRSAGPAASSSAPSATTKQPEATR